MAAKLYTRKIAGTNITASGRTIWHLRWTIFKLALRYPRARLRIIQSCYRALGGGAGARLSAGTHDYDCVFDVEITGMPGKTAIERWYRAQSFLRNHGWGAWFRHTGDWAAASAWHLHIISLPPGLPANPTVLQVGKAYAKAGQKVGKYIDGGYTSTGGHIIATSQVDDYFAHALGLAGQHRAGSDHSWFPANLPRHVFRQVWWPNRYTGSTV